jgi:hypothetical protein
MSGADAEGQVDVVRRGGIAGVSAHASVDLRSLPPEVAAALDRVLSGRVAATPARGRADMFTYEFSVGQGAHKRAARLAEHDLPRELAPLLDAAGQRWKVG